MEYCLCDCEECLELDKREADEKKLIKAIFELEFFEFTALREMSQPDEYTPG